MPLSERGLIHIKEVTIPIEPDDEDISPSDEEFESIRLQLSLDECSRRTLVVYESGKPKIIPDGGTLYL